MKTVRIGSGAGFAGDRIEPAVELAEKGELDYLAFECLAERTIALAQQEKMHDPSAGYDGMLVRRLKAVLPAARAKGTKIITNMGAANPKAAAEAAQRVAREMGLKGLRIAAVTGDDVLDLILQGDYRLDGDGRPVSELGNKLVSANAYTGIEGIVDALEQGADIVITGRAADPVLFLAPLVHEFGWARDDWSALGRGTLVGHLLECAAQVTGGYFADPGVKDVPDMLHIGYPLAEVRADGGAVITKVAGSGGVVSTATCTEQLLYEVHDPSTYFQPDVVADFSKVTFTHDGPDRVVIDGAAGAKRTGLLKVSVGYVDGWIGEGQISYAGPAAEERGRLAIDLVEQRLAALGPKVLESRGELIGVNSVLPGNVSQAPPREVRVRFAARCESREDAQRIGEEVESLYLNGPYGGGGVTKQAREVVAIASTFIPETLVSQTVTMLES
ncbi:acyclic terpene utilization AtuA family protein [Hwanghaeella sp.]|uniref:acyclic terpene utilization AtuA family protein n=1 Tax=Hwanghaeella sp. TaxID=2605943 RepID=UPI003CCC335C